VVLGKAPHLQNDEGHELVTRMVTLANLTRSAFQIFKDPALSFELVFMNKCDPSERAILNELYQRVFAVDLAEET